MSDILCCNVADGNQTFQSQDTLKCRDIFIPVLTCPMDSLTSVPICPNSNGNWGDTLKVNQHTWNNN